MDNVPPDGAPLRPDRSAGRLLRDIEERFTLGEPLQRDDKLISYRAVDAHGRDVVLTFLVPSDPARFLDELRLVSGVAHPALAPLLDWGVVDGRVFVARQDVPGRTLDQVLVERGRLPWQQAATIGIEVAAALGALHNWGAVHGGVSPRSVMTTPDGEVRLIDAALARASWPADMTSLDPAWTAEYRTPEEVMAREVTPASDVYALGLVLFALLTGRPPFGGATAEDVAARQVGREPPRPALLAADVPEVLERVVMHALAKQPEDRYRSIDQMRRDLERAAAGLEVAAPELPGLKPPPLASRTVAATRRAPWMWASAAALGVIVLLLLLLALGAFEGGQVAVPQVTGLTVERARETLDDAGLVLGSIATAPSPVSSVTGTILTQDPAAGVQVGEGSRVNVTVAGSPTLTVPDLLGKTQAEAQQELQAVGLVLERTINVYDQTFPNGQVAGQLPAAGQPIAPGGNVAIALSLGPPPAGLTAQAVPSVVGQPGQEAATQLQSMGWVVVVWEQTVAGRTPGEVLAQVPVAGSLLTPGSTVIILVAAGERPVSPVPTSAPTSPLPTSPAPTLVP
jgi:serine/threonine-protein kinase